MHVALHCLVCASLVIFTLCLVFPPLLLVFISMPSFVFTSTIYPPLALYFISVICVVTFLIFFFLSVPVRTSHSRKVEKENLPAEVHLGSLSLSLF